MKHKYLLSTLILSFVSCTSCKTTKGLQPGQEAISEANPAGESTARSQDGETDKKAAIPAL